MRYTHENSLSKAALPKKQITVFHCTDLLPQFQLAEGNEIASSGNFVLTYLEHILEESSNITLAWEADYAIRPCVLPSGTAGYSFYVLPPATRTAATQHSRPCRVRSGVESSRIANACLATGSARAALLSTNLFHLLYTESLLAEPGPTGSK